MYRSCTFKREHFHQKLRVSDFVGYLKGKSTLMIYDRHPELQSKWIKRLGLEDIMLKRLAI